MKIPGIEGSIELSSELGHGWMLAWRFIVEVIQEARGDVVWDDNFILELAWSVSEAVTCSDE